MLETTQVDVAKMISKIYRDAMIKNSSKNFITLTYMPENFPDNMRVALHRVLGFLPNTNYQGKPFIMSVSTNKGTQEIEIVVKNPKL